MSKKVVVAYANIFLVRNNNQSHVMNTCNIIKLMITIIFLNTCTYQIYYNKCILTEKLKLSLRAL